jgi:uncharacterized protein YdcH (DUF465 family)
MKQVGSFRATERNGASERLTQIEAHHRDLDQRIQELGRHTYLTPSEQVEVAELKKHRLRAKDELFALRRQ